MTGFCQGIRLDSQTDLSVFINASKAISEQCSVRRNKIDAIVSSSYAMMPYVQSNQILE